jgi:hypothetical protein
MRGRRGLHLTVEFGGLLRGGPRPEKIRDVPALAARRVLAALLGAAAQSPKYAAGLGRLSLQVFEFPCFVLAGCVSGARDSASGLVGGTQNIVPRSCALNSLRVEIEPGVFCAAMQD